MARGNSGPRVGFCPFEAGLAARVEKRLVVSRENLRLGRDFVTLVRLELCCARRRLSAFGRPVFGTHFWNPPSRMATRLAPKWRSMNQPRAAVRIGELS